MAGASPLLASPGDPADLREFGQVKGWKDAENEDVYPKAAGPPWRAIREQGGDGHWNLGVEWDEPREFSEVHVAFQEPVPADSVRIEYWVSSWPPPEGRGGWTETDTPWRRAWKLVHASSCVENGEIVFTFNPLSADENPRAKNRPGYQPKFRRALKMRLRMESSFLPVLTRFQVFGAARWSEREVRIETGCEGKPKSEPQFQIYNGRLVEKRVDGDATRLRLMYLEHLPESNDGTLLTMNAGGLQFGVAVDDVIRRKAIYVRDAGVFVADGPSAETFASYLASGSLRPGQDIYARIGKAGEQSLERAMSEIPALSMMYRSSRHPNRYIPVGFPGSREKYGVDFNGNLFISKGGSKAFVDEQARMLWSDDTLWFRIGTGAVPDFREREGAARQHVVDNELPIVITEWSSDGINYREESFATLLDAPLDPWKNRGDEISAFVVKVTATNASAHPAPAAVWLHVSPGEQLRVRDGVLEGIGASSVAYSKPRFRATLQASRGDFQISEVPAASGYTGAAARWQTTLELADRRRYSSG